MADERYCAWERRRFPRAHFDDDGVHLAEEGGPPVAPAHNFEGYRVDDNGDPDDLEATADEALDDFE